MQIDEGADLVYVFDTNSIQLEKEYFLGTYMEKMKSDLFLEFKKKLLISQKIKSFMNRILSI